MKKWLYILSGAVLGVVLTVSSSAFADQVKSLVGKKVTGEYTVVVNGKTLSDKGLIIDGGANVPARPLSEALGADVQVSGKTINITSNSVNSSDLGDQVSGGASSATNKYLGGTKESLETLKKSIEERILKPTKEGRENILAEIKVLKETEAKGVPVPVLAEKEKQIAQYDADIEKYTEELRLVNEALETAK